MGVESAGEGARGGGSAMERERLSYKEFGSLPADEGRFALFTAVEATFQARASRSNRIGNRTGRNMQNGPVVPQTALSRLQTADSLLFRQI
jgi:hypothetical protein